MNPAQHIYPITGGRVVTVSRDGGVTTEDITVRQLPISALDVWYSHLANEAKMIELYAGKEPGWADTLNHEDCIRILEAGEEVNQGFFRCSARRATTLQRLAPQLVGEIMAGLSQSGSPKSPSPQG